MAISQTLYQTARWMMQKRFLFVTGCPRSGTSILAGVLSTHPDIVLGMERYNLRIANRLLRPSDFERQRFFDVQPSDTWYKSIDQFKPYYESMNAKYDSARYVGDKYPGAYQHYVYLREHFSDVYFIFIIRNIFDVALSFEGRRERGDNWPADGGTEYAVERWNDSILYTLRWRDESRILVLSYEDLFIRGGSAQPIANFLAVDPEPLEVALHHARTSSRRDTGPGARLTPEQADYISRYASFGAFRLLLGIDPLQKPNRQAASIGAASAGATG